MRVVKWFGVVAVCAAGMAPLLYVARQGDHITVTAQFDSASGLYEGGVVAVLGMPVGEVETITPKGGYVDVQFTVDKNVKVPVDVQAVTVSTSILTDRQIELTPPYRGGPLLNDHDTIGLDRTKTPVEFDRVVGVLDKLSVSLAGDGKGQGPVADIVNAGAGVADGNGLKIKAALDELSKALRPSGDGGALTSAELTTIIRNINALMDATAQNDATLREFAASIHALSEIIDDESLGTGNTGKTLTDVVKQIGDVLEANRDHIKQSILNGGKAFKSMTEHQRDLAEVIDVLPLAMENIYNIIDQDNGSIRVRGLTDKIIFDETVGKEICNLMGLRQLGCSTGTLQDYGPDFGLSYILDGLAAMGQK
ncbi:mammalian cell entry protein [Mycobacteroides chelonae]|nr:mammalian cell entry protein [Mycobacteroides chelonae]